ncbi:LysR family transcriptional regulator [Amycolatopsis sp. NBC_00345]|uniref:LysR family transcriptional regulator n=1 Tax=Amycolatopsis sp. NBC_00345 TaxID=2975955 RepID=UPI002E26F02F
MDLTLHQLEIFTRVARSGSFTQAARELLLSQPVLSRTVRDVERVLATTLFERTTRSVELTAEGREFLAVAEDILTGYRAGMNRFAGYRAGDRGTITLSALPSIAATLLPPVVSAFLAGHPAVRFTILDGTTQEVLDHVRAGTADLAFTETAVPDPGLVTRPLREEPMLAVLPAGHHLAARSRLTWADLARETFIAFTSDSSIRRLTDLAFTQAEAVPTSVVETRTVATAAGMIAAGLGISAMPELVLPLASFAPVVARPLDSPAVTRKLAVHSRRSPPLSPAAGRFLEHLVTAVLEPA